MIIDKDGKLFGKISIIDVIVILVVIVAAIGMCLRMIPEKVEPIIHTDREPQKIEYTIKVKGIREGNVEALKRRGEIFELSTGERFGRIVKAEAEEAVDNRDTMTGEIIAMNTPEKYDVLLTVRLDANVAKEAYYTNWDVVLSIGSRYDLFTKYSRMSGEVMSIREID